MNIKSANGGTIPILEGVRIAAEDEIKRIERRVSKNQREEENSLKRQSLTKRLEETRNERAI
jgi:hypothetical protein